MAVGCSPADCACAAIRVASTFLNSIAVGLGPAASCVRLAMRGSSTLKRTASAVIRCTKPEIQTGSGK